MESFDDMLNELYENLNETNVNLQINLSDPILIKNGSNTNWKNVKDFLKIIKRPPDHFIIFLRKEMNCQINWVTSSKSDGLTIDQTKIKSDKLLNIMKTYLKDYVICKSCKSLDTIIEKSKDIRKFKFICQNCNNEYFL